MGVLVNITKEVIEAFIEEAKNEDNMGKFKNHVMDPLIDYTFKKLYPYIVITSVLFLLTFILAIAILYMLIQQNFTK